MSDRFRWGILGTGAIANLFAEGLSAIPDAELAAVGSRSEATARAFVDQFGARRIHASYQALASDPEIDAIYIASPHSFHREHTLLCIEHGKNVLCEKPFAINVAQAEEMIAAAREKGVFLMEAMWTRFNPVVVRLREMLAEGVIGEVRQLTADFGFRADFDAEHRLFNPELGGGALLDVGIYPVSFARIVFGQGPESFVSLAEIGKSGVDEQSAYLFRYANGALALMSAAVRTETPHEATLCGTEGMIRIPRHFWNPDRMIVNGEEQRFDVVGNGYNYEAQAVMECVRSGGKECDVMSHAETLAVQGDLDAIREQWSLRYPVDGER